MYVLLRTHIVTRNFIIEITCVLLNITTNVFVYRFCFLVRCRCT